MPHCGTHHGNRTSFRVGAGRWIDSVEWGGTFSAVPLSFELLSARWSDSGNGLAWSSPFVLPPWLESWWSVFGAGLDLLLWEIRDGERLLGIAPLCVEGETARFIGDVDVCDYQDFIVAAGRDYEFFKALLQLLSRQGIRRLDLSMVRPDSLTMRTLPVVAGALGSEVLREEGDVSFEMRLPPTWEVYLSGLSGKERHEVHRKFRRLDQKSTHRFEVLEAPRDVGGAMDEFLRLFRLSRAEKSEFLTGARERFLRLIVQALAERRLVKLCFLEVDGTRAAAALCFDYQGRIYLYNSGLDPDFRHLSVGLLCKLLTLRRCIEDGRLVYDFLKGAETYKRRLGARPVPLYHCRLFRAERPSVQKAF
jgi:CelD/BcsL family acetyltransferase involved in cellulose biosynthesis